MPSADSAPIHTLATPHSAVHPGRRRAIAALLVLVIVATLGAGLGQIGLYGEQSGLWSKHNNCPGLLCLFSGN